jgi:hypothetical protein
MGKRRRPDLEQVRDAMRQHDEDHADEPEPEPEPEAPREDDEEDPADR